MQGDQVEGLIEFQVSNEKSLYKGSVSGTGNRPVEQKENQKDAVRLHRKGILASHNLKNKNVLNKMYFCIL